MGRPMARDSSPWSSAAPPPCAAAPSAAGRSPARAAVRTAASASAEGQQSPPAPRTNRPRTNPTCQVAATCSLASPRASLAPRRGSRLGEGRRATAAVRAPEEIPEVQRTWNRWDWAAGYGPCTEDPDGYWLEVEGQLPLELEGTYFRNGPGRLGNGSPDRVAHPFDADGLLVSVSISGGRAYFRSRFVETAECKIEMQEGRRVFRGSFGTQICGGFWQNFLELAPRNAANTSVVTWGGRCLALFEAGQPYSINAATLETLGVDTLGGLLREGLPFSTGSQVLDWGLEDVLDSCGVSSPMPGGVKLGGDALSAHPCKCTSTGRLVTFSYSIQLRMNGFAPGLKTVITFYELDKDLRLVSSLDYVLDGYAFIHDFQVTEGHYVLIQNPVSLDLVPFLMGTKSPVQCLRFEPREPARVHLIHRAPPGQVAERHGGPVHCMEREGGRAAVVEIDPCFVFHLANATEQRCRGDTCFTVDCIRYTEMPNFDDLMGYGAGFEFVRPECQPKSELWRLEVDKGSRTARFRQINEKAMEFACSARQAGVPRYVYAAAALHPSLNMPQQAVARVDTISGEVEAWSRGGKYYVGEPTFVSRPGGFGPDDGWLVVMCFDASSTSSELVVLDAQQVSGGPLAVCRLREPVPHGLHGHWAEESYAPRAD